MSRPSKVKTLRTLLAGMCSAAACVWIYGLVWNSPPLPGWAGVVAFVALQLGGVTLFFLKGTSDLKDRIEGLEPGDRELLKRIHARSYGLIAVIFLGIGGLLIVAELRPTTPPQTYRYVVGSLVLLLILAIGLSLRMKATAARLLAKSSKAPNGVY